MADSKKQVRPGGPLGRGHGYQRPQNLRGTVGKLLAYIGRYKAALIVVAVCLVLSSVGSVASSYFLKPALNHIVAGDFKGLFWMLVAMGGVFLLDLFLGMTTAYTARVSLISYLTLNIPAVLQGQIWRLVTWLFVPQQGSIFWMALSLYFYYMIGTALENRWGARRFLIYYVIGALANVAGAFIAHLLTGYGIGLNTYLYYSLFIAFAALYPDMQFMLFFCIPVKAKWLAAIDLLYFLIAIIAGPAQIRCAAIASLVNVALFFGEDIYKMARIQYAQWKRRRMFRQ